MTGRSNEATHSRKPAIKTAARPNQTTVRKDLRKNDIRFRNYYGTDVCVKLPYFEPGKYVDYFNDIVTSVNQDLEGEQVDRSRTEWFQSVGSRTRAKRHSFLNRQNCGNQD